MNYYAPSTDFDWSFVDDADDKERMCRSLDFDSMTNSSTSMFTVYGDRSEPSLTKKVKKDDQGMFGYQKFKGMLDVAKTKESFKDRILSMWTNTKNGFMAKLTQEFKDSSEIWMLGRCYKNEVAAFKKDFQNLPWITYRRGFPELGSQRMTSDVGWGCMIRCAQMCLAVTLTSHCHSTKGKNVSRRELLRMFGDEPNKECPFSIHSLVLSGEAKGRLPGSWFGPASISVALREVLKDKQAQNQIFNDLAIYIAQDSTVYIRDALEEMKKENRSLMLIIPMRLGFNQTNEVYMEAFKRVFHWKFCVGIMGGRPKHSLFFVGYQDNDLIYLDPHFNQDIVDLGFTSSLESYQCATPMKLNLSKMDPTCAVTFYCSNQSDLWELISLVRQTEDEFKRMKSMPGALKPIPMLHFVDARHVDLLDPDRDFPNKEDDDFSNNTSSSFHSTKEESGRKFPLVSEDTVDGNVNTFKSAAPVDVDCDYNRNQSAFDRAFASRFNSSANHFRSDESSMMTYDNAICSYSMLEDSRATRDEVSTVEFNDFSLISDSRENHRKPSNGCIRNNARRTEWSEDGRGMREEDGFVML